MSLAELRWLDATAQADLVRQGLVTPLELLDAAIARIEEHNGDLNAVVSTRFEQARSDAASTTEGPFQGVPMLLKDFLAHWAGDPVHGGMRLLRDRDWRASENSHLATRLRAAGFVFCGRTNTPELATSLTTEPLAHGATHNPWDLTRSPGGSSGGSAAAVAAGLVPVAHGNDMAGSIRVPASACGVVGLKPSRGRNSLGPQYGDHWGSVTHEHVLTRSVRDTAAVLDATAGAAAGDPHSAPPPARPFRLEAETDPGPLRIGFRTEAPGTGETAHPDCVTAVENTARLLESLGHHVAPAAAPALDAPGLFDAMPPVLAAAVAWELDSWSERLGEQLSPSVLEPMNAMLCEAGRQVTAVQWLSAITASQRWARGVAALWEDELDILLTPTLPAPPGKLGELSPEAAPPEQLSAGIAMLGAFTAPYNITGQPAISLPLHWNADGLPIGLQFAAARNREDVLLRLAGQLERAAPWSGRRPPE
ncbi:amidase [Amycolatopsis saalfeldensis]|uniref:Amidase n=1 Tax=Amycolatopsis saalfeldensis TaxID=394193 RepID=A0A1H8XHP3_9PSEU|nr:amidase [Amycolatopsis saalfeldensis]SEP39386.1 amidase [Amycolatopsis saalfeldensis]